MYGLYSTLVSSYTIKNFHYIGSIAEILNKPGLGGHGDINRLKHMLGSMSLKYSSYTFDEYKKILDEARSENISGDSTIFQAFRTYLTTPNDNIEFLSRMANADSSDLRPRKSWIVDNSFVDYSMQFNAHRGVYNAAYGIPQNSMLSLINGFLAGMTSFELDVMQSKDGKCVVIHDMVTNRENGAFNDPPNYVESLNYSSIENLPVKILNPLAGTPTAADSLVTRTPTIDDVYTLMRYVLTNATLYVDARNNSPACAIRALKNLPKTVKDRVVIKVYPFLLNRGAQDLIDAYRTLTQTSDPVAEMADIYPNLLLVVGSAPSQVSDLVQLQKLDRDSKTDYSYNNVDYARFTKVLSKIPYSQTSTIICGPSGRKCNEYMGIGTGSSPPTKDELALIEIKTLNTLKWILGFSMIGKPLVLQMAATPSPQANFMASSSVLVDAVGPNRFSRDALINAAVSDNIVAIHGLIKTSDPSTNFWTYWSAKDKQDYPVAEAFRGVLYGISDRFPDFSFLKSNGISTRDFNYGMDGVAYETTSDYSAYIMHSLLYIYSRITNHNTYFSSQSGKMVYVTTDIPEDLTATFMRHPKMMNLTQGFRRHGLVKTRLTPSDAGIDNFVLKDWVTHLSGDISRMHPQFLSVFKDTKEIKDRIAVNMKAYQLLMHCNTNPNSGMFISDRAALSALGRVRPLRADPTDPTASFTCFMANQSIISQMNQDRATFNGKEVLLKLYGYNGIADYSAPPPYVPVAP